MTVINTTIFCKIQKLFSMSILPYKVTKPFKAAIIGSGNWGTTIAKLVAENCKEKPQLFDPIVKMWVHEEFVDGKSLVDIINQQHENVKYLPNINLPSNLVANKNIFDVAQDADLLIFNIPHQFLTSILKQLKGINPNIRAISCLKGLEVNSHGCKLLSTSITETLGLHCGVLSGANIASEVAQEKWSETTIAYLKPQDFRGYGDDIDEFVLKELIHRPYFHVNVINDVAGTSISGALKNIVALAAGFVDHWGDNAKAAIMRVGLLEMIKFSKFYYKFGIDVDIPPSTSTFTDESCGIADLITTCSGGRNVKVAKYMIQNKVSAWEAEKILLNGQSSQGILTVNDVHILLTNLNLAHEFPLFEATYKMVYENADINEFPTLLAGGCSHKRRCSSVV